MPRPRPGVCIADACALLDYVDAAPAVITLSVQHLGGVHVPRYIAEELPTAQRNGCGRLGLTIVHETTEQLMAASDRRGSLSFASSLACVLAHSNPWLFTTNDPHLQRELDTNEVPWRCELGLIIELLRASACNVTMARDLAARITATNRGITANALADFERHVTHPGATRSVARPPRCARSST